MGVFNVDGANQSRDVYIRDVKAKYTSYNDDQLLSEAIALAQSLGNQARIIWDGTDIHFSGSETHVCKSFGGIDFNGSKVYMPNYDGGIILSIEPDTANDITVSASDLYESYTTNTDLKGKIFRMNEPKTGNADMCLGDRWGDGQTLYSAPTIRTTLDGKYTTGDLYLTPSSGNVVCCNVHDYPLSTFDLCNATIISNASANMSVFAKCCRSNTHIRNIRLEGVSGVTVFHSGVICVDACSDIEIDHIYGTNPIIEANASGYAIGLYSATNTYVHDVCIGDSISWGVIGSNYLTNVVFERCHINRWDCHYAQYGYNVIRDCTLNKVCYGVGNGTLLIENCVITANKTTASVNPLVLLRDDITGAFDGNIIVRGCVFERTIQSAEKITIWYDGCLYTRSSNSAITGSPKRGRYLERCVLPSACHSVFTVGVTDSANLSDYENIVYSISDIAIPDVDVLVEAQNASQALKQIEIKGCQFSTEDFITTTLTKAPIVISDCDFGANSAKITANEKSVKVANSTLKSVVASQASAKLLITGSVFSGSQSVSNFTAYALSGNIASDMASVNKHSS